MRIRQEALAAFYANRAAHQHDALNYGIGQGMPAAPPSAPPAPADNRSMLQKLMDALGGNPSGR